MARDRSTVKRCLATLALLEMLQEEDDRVTKRGKTRHWIKRRGEEEYFNNIAAAGIASSRRSVSWAQRDTNGARKK